MGDNMRKMLLTGIPFGLTMGLLLGIMSKASIGIIAGIIYGVVFAILINVFVKIQSKKFKKIRSLIVEGDDIVKEGAANHFVGKESVGGWLYLTNKAIIFRSHNFNIQNHQIIIPLSEIIEVKTSLTLGVVPNGIQVITNGEMESFVVHKRKDWIEKIYTALPSPYGQS